jgi:hypothetical protein
MYNGIFEIVFPGLAQNVDTFFEIIIIKGIYPFPHNIIPWMLAKQYRKYRNDGRNLFHVSGIYGN